MNILACSRHLLTHFSPEERDIPDHVDYPDRNAAVLAAQNGALQELYGRGGKWVRQDDRGSILFAPTTVRITVATGSTAATIHTDDWQAWMAGCSIVIDGSAVDNQIRNASATVTLKYPHDGASGATTGTVYCDSVTVASDALEVIEPVRIDRRQITPMPSPYAAQQGHPLGDFNFHQHSRDNPLPVARLAESASAPAGFVVETWAPDQNAQNQIRIRLWPATNAQYVLDYKIMLKPPRIESLLNLAGVTAATLVVGSHSSAVIYESAIPDASGNDITVSHTIVAGSITITVTAKAIAITFPSGTTAAQVVAAVNADEAASLLIRPSVGESSGVGAAAAITATHLAGGTGTYGIYNTDELPVPFDQVETIFLPLAIKRLSQGPFWRGVTNEQAVNDSFKEAGDLLSKANPSPTSGVRFNTRF